MHSAWLLFSPFLRNPIPEDVKVGKANVAKTNGLCTLHIADPCYTRINEIWGSCLNKDFGCRFLSQKRGGGKCFACSEGNLPCANATCGCPMHVRNNSNKRKLKACMSHASVPCAFDPSQARVTCSTPWCGNKKEHLETDRRSFCNRGNPPCVGKCSRRAISNGRCSFCPDDGTPPFLPAALPTQQCVTLGCLSIVVDEALCFHCASGSFPCSTRNCSGRTADRDHTACDACLQSIGKTMRITRKRTPHPCKYFPRGCLNSTPSEGLTCKPCLTSGPPCSGQPWGCKFRCKKELSAQRCPKCLVCAACPAAEKNVGCGNLKKGNVPRRALPHNKGMCVLCRKKACKVDSCVRLAHPLHWRDRLCRKHGSDTRGILRRPYETNGRRLTDVVRRGLLGKSIQRYKKCTIEWCDQRARPRKDSRCSAAFLRCPCVLVAPQTNRQYGRVAEGTFRSEVSPRRLRLWRHAVSQAF